LPTIAPQIKAFSAALGHVPIIDTNPRRGEKKAMHPAQAVGFKERSRAERVNSNLKDNYGGRFVRVRGAAKVMMHLMFGVIAITATQLFRLLESTEDEGHSHFTRQAWLPSRPQWITMFRKRTS